MAQPRRLDEIEVDAGDREARAPQGEHGDRGAALVQAPVLVNNTSACDSTSTASEDRIRFDPAGRPPLTTTRFALRASSAHSERQRAKRGDSCTSTTSGSAARITRPSASRSSRIERTL